MLTPRTATANTLIPVPSFFVGFSLRETSGSAAALRLRNGSDTGPILFSLSFSANQSLALILPIIRYSGAARGGFSSTGVYVEVLSGTVEGSLFVL